VEICWDEFNFLCKRLKIVKFLSLKRSPQILGAAITAPGDTNPSDATEL